MSSRSIGQISRTCHAIAVSKGFWKDRNPDDVFSTLTEMALIHSEVSEAVEAIRKGDMENFAEELADICIRVFDTAVGHGVDLEAAILQKMQKNAQREHMHGKKA